MKLRSAAAVTLLSATVLVPAAHAVRDPGYLDERPLERASGERGRLARAASWTTPASAARPWREFLAAHGSWKALWDADTGLPTRIFGEGIAAPGSIADAAIAEQAARRILVEQLALLAPGAKPDDFVPALNVLEGNRTHRVVVLAQTWNGLPVTGAKLSFLFAHDRLIVIGSMATPPIAATLPARVVDGTLAETIAVGWIEQLYGAAPVVLSRGATELLPVIDERGTATHHVVVPVTVDLATPRARWTVYLDAATGKPVARRQLLMFADGTLRYRVPQRYPGGGYYDAPAAHGRHTVDGATVMSSATGQVSWAGATATTVLPALAGSFAEVINAAGAIATATLPLDPDGNALWDLSASPEGDAQLNAFIHATVVNRFAKSTLNADLEWLDRPISVSVNEEGVCNAFSTGDDIHFYVAYNQTNLTCANTGTLPDVIFHEFGHSLHNQSLTSGDWDGALSEGISDYLAATMTGDPATGIGFYGTTEPLRHIDPAGFEHRWPDDVAEIHYTGLIIAGTLWDARKALIDELGAAAGQALADDIFYGVIQRSSDIPTTYVEALATDDDDGNLANGTPHQCAIDRAWATHGLTASAGFGELRPPVTEGLTVTQPQIVGGDTCAPPRISSARAVWKLRGVADSGGEVSLDAAADSFAGSLPEQPDGSVVQYQVEVTLEDGQLRTFPSNSASPWYELYVGPVTPIYCMDFERDPTLEGWTLGDGFTWGVTEPGRSGFDPAEAYSPSHILGNSIGGNGRYQSEVNLEARMAELDVTGFANVRLQYRRWLTVEDGVFDQASITADGATLWQNASSNTGALSHHDREWRFHDVDLTPLSGNGKVQVAFKLKSNDSTTMGGWAIDDLCVVAAQAPACGDGVVTASNDEQCDDRNLDDGDGCSAACLSEGVEPIADDPGCCSTGRGSSTGAWLLGLAVLLSLREARRARTRGVRARLRNAARRLAAALRTYGR